MNRMGCRQVQRAVLNDAVTDSDRVRQHVDACPACREWITIHADVCAIGKAERQRDLPPDVVAAARMQAHRHLLETAAPTVAVLQWRPALALAAVVLIVAGLGTLRKGASKPDAVSTDVALIQQADRPIASTENKALRDIDRRIAEGFDALALNIDGFTREYGLGYGRPDVLVGRSRQLRDQIRMAALEYAEVFGREWPESMVNDSNVDTGK